jgi:hypothetical protein
MGPIRLCSHMNVIMKVMFWHNENIIDYVKDKGFNLCKCLEFNDVLLEPFDGSCFRNALSKTC